MAMRGSGGALTFAPPVEFEADSFLSMRGSHRRRMPARHLRHLRFMHRHRRAQRTAAHVIADGLQPLQNSLPLRPIELTQKRTQTLDEWIFEERLARGFRHEEAVQPNAQSFGNLLERAEAGGHLPALDA